MDLKVYTDEMAKSVWDKAFFMDKIIGAKVVADFGCADGAMISFLAPLFPHITFIGYDCNSRLIHMALNKCADLPNVVFYYENELEEMLHNINADFKPEEICVNFSSVLHEIFSNHSEGILTIQRILKKLHPHYITIRDMYFYDNSAAWINEEFINAVLSQLHLSRESAYVEDFENFSGKIHDLRDLVHFLIKYQWRGNGWNNELEENYFSLTTDEVEKTFALENYNPIFENRYLLPYLRNLWKDSELVNYDFSTHCQIILERTNS